MSEDIFTAQVNPPPQVDFNQYANLQLQSVQPTSFTNFSPSGTPSLSLAPTQFSQPLAQPVFTQPSFVGLGVNPFQSPSVNAATAMSYGANPYQFNTTPLSLGPSSIPSVLSPWAVESPSLAPVTSPPGHQMDQPGMFSLGMDIAQDLTDFNLHDSVVGRVVPSLEVSDLIGVQNPATDFMGEMSHIRHELHREPSALEFKTQALQDRISEAPLDAFTPGAEGYDDLFSAQLEVNIERYRETQSAEKLGQATALETDTIPSLEEQLGIAKRRLENATSARDAHRESVFKLTDPDAAETGRALPRWLRTTGQDRAAPTISELETADPGVRAAFDKARAEVASVEKRLEEAKTRVATLREEAASFSSRSPTEMELRVLNDSTRDAIATAGVNKRDAELKAERDLRAAVSGDTAAADEWLKGVKALRDKEAADALLTPVGEIDPLISAVAKTDTGLRDDIQRARTLDSRARDGKELNKADTEFLAAYQKRLTTDTNLSRAHNQVQLLRDEIAAHPEVAKHVVDGELVEINNFSIYDSMAARNMGLNLTDPAPEVGGVDGHTYFSNWDSMPGGGRLFRQRLSTQSSQIARAPGGNIPAGVADPAAATSISESMRGDYERLAEANSGLRSIEPGEGGARIAGTPLVDLERAQEHFNKLGLPEQASKVGELIDQKLAAEGFFGTRNSETGKYESGAKFDIAGWAEEQRANIDGLDESLRPRALRELARQENLLRSAKRTYTAQIANGVPSEFVSEDWKSDLENAGMLFSSRIDELSRADVGRTKSGLWTKKGDGSTTPDVALMMALGSLALGVLAPVMQSIESRRMFKHQLRDRERDRELQRELMAMRIEGQIGAAHASSPSRGTPATLNVSV